MPAICRRSSSLRSSFSMRGWPGSQRPRTRRSCSSSSMNAWVLVMDVAPLRKGRTGDVGRRNVAPREPAELLEIDRRHAERQRRDTVNADGVIGEGEIVLGGREPPRRSIGGHDDERHRVVRVALVKLERPRPAVGGHPARDPHLADRVVHELRRVCRGHRAGAATSKANVASPTEYRMPWYFSRRPGASLPTTPARRKKGRFPASGAAWRNSSASILSRSEEHTSELQSLAYLVCRLLLEKKNRQIKSRRSPDPDSGP